MNTKRENICTYLAIKVTESFKYWTDLRPSWKISLSFHLLTYRTNTEWLLSRADVDFAQQIRHWTVEMCTYSNALTFHWCLDSITYLSTTSYQQLFVKRGYQGWREHTAVSSGDPITLTTSSVLNWSTFLISKPSSPQMTHLVVCQLGVS